MMDSSTGIDLRHEEGDSDGDDHNINWKRSPSPVSSVSYLAASFVQRVNNFVGATPTQKSPSLPTDAELEAEAERERERSRREAEAILSKEAQERNLVEERVLEMLGSSKSLPPPPSRSYTTPGPPSPVGSQKDTSWWQAAKNRLTPTKDPLTPAQQVIQDAKFRDKEHKKLFKAKEKEFQKAKENEWPAKPDSKYTDPSFANLNIPVAPPNRKPVPASPSSPTPSRPSLSNMPPVLTPSPMRASDTLSSSPSREAPPLYAQFNPQGSLDVPGTLLAIAKRFEKLERWTVGHVRALEDRMNDVERWLVDKEKEKQETSSVKETPKENELQDMREEVAELQGRVGELGREMAKLATSASNLSSGPKPQIASVIHGAAPSTSSVLVQQHSGSSIIHTPHHRLSSSTAGDSIGPPMVSTNRTPFPYPQGDFASPSDAILPAISPPGSLGISTRIKSLSISGLPNGGQPASASSILQSQSSFESLATLPSSPTSSGQGLPLPRRLGSPRQTSVSPTPRKRYTVALGDRIMASSPSSDDIFSSAANPDPQKRTGKPKWPNQDDDENELGDDTIGKSVGSRLVNSATFSSSRGDYKNPEPSPLTSRRYRTQSAYGFIPGSCNTTTLPPTEPLKPKIRSKSSERLSFDSSPHATGTGDGMVSALGGSTKFVDPLVLRKQSRDSLTKPIAMPRPLSGKIPVGKLVAFFDGEKK